MHDETTTTACTGSVQAPAPSTSPSPLPTDHHPYLKQRMLTKSFVSDVHSVKNKPGAMNINAAAAGCGAIAMSIGAWK
jgi:hypothetical protein